MNTRMFALVLGIAFLQVGIAGFIPGLTVAPAHDHGLAVQDPGHGYLFGLFHVNLLHNLVHILFGIWGIIAYRTLDASKLYSQVVAISYAVLAILGLLPAPINTLFGLVPIHGHDVWLHAIIAVLAGYFGWLAVRTPEEGTPHAGTPATGLR
jgi:hypothetical protein